MKYRPALDQPVTVIKIAGPARENKSLTRHVGRDGKVSAIDTRNPVSITVQFPNGEKARFLISELEASNG